MFLIPHAGVILLSGLLIVSRTENDALGWGWNQHQMATCYTSSYLYTSSSPEDGNVTESSPPCWGWY